VTNTTGSVMNTGLVESDSTRGWHWIEVRRPMPSREARRSPECRLGASFGGHSSAFPVMSRLAGRQSPSSAITGGIRKNHGAGFGVRSAELRRRGARTIATCQTASG
jgi:hypothetical protein